MTSGATVVDAVDRYIQEHLAESVEDLKRLARIPSVSAKGGAAMEDAAKFVAGLLSGAGFGARLLPTDGGFPVVYADTGEGDTGASPRAGRTLICYNHYDVQPEEPLELWQSPPFEPTEREGRLYARGVSDDKGQLVSRIAAMHAVRAITGGYPVRVKFLVEGEEEIGSIHLSAFVEARRALLAADACVWESGGVNAEGAPTVQLGMRGILAVELRVRTLARDAHSGQAHNLPNAAWRLVRALASLKDEHERILIAGWYDDVRGPSEAERRLLEQMPSDEAVARELYGVHEFVEGHTGLDYKAAVYSPTCNIAGIGAGWQGPGSKTVIPAVAMAKLDFRLVPEQDPLDLLTKLRRHLDAHGFADVEVANTEGGGERAATTPPDDPFVQLAARTGEGVYGRPAVLVPLVGGSGPMWAFRSVLETPIVTLGTADPYTSVHAPNESISLACFAQGIRHMARLLLAYGAEAGSGT
jgi:acetylornithine deacetylase/succinyl-diaminopimelate desuccinylase-like protein